MLADCTLDSLHAQSSSPAVQAYKICDVPFDGPTVGPLNAESPKSNNHKKKKGSRNRRFSYGLATYFACANLYTFPMVPACVPTP